MEQIKIREGATMSSNAEAVKRHQEKTDAIMIRPYKEQGQIIRDYAAAHGCSVQALLLAAVAEYMEQDKTPAEVKKGRKKAKQD